MPSERALASSVAPEATVMVGLLGIRTDVASEPADVQARYFDNGDKFPPQGRIELPRDAWRPAAQTPTCVGP